MIKVGDTRPPATLQEYSEVEGEGCSIGPNPVDVSIDLGILDPVLNTVGGFDFFAPAN